MKIDRNSRNSIELRVILISKPAFGLSPCCMQFIHYSQTYLYYKICIFCDVFGVVKNNRSIYIRYISVLLCFYFGRLLQLCKLIVVTQLNLTFMEFICIIDFRTFRAFAVKEIYIIRRIIITSVYIFSLARLLWYVHILSLVVNKHINSSRH